MPASSTSAAPASTVQEEKYCLTGVRWTSVRTAMKTRRPSEPMGEASRHREARKSWYLGGMFQETAMARNSHSSVV